MERIAREPPRLWIALLLAALLACLGIWWTMGTIGETKTGHYDPDEIRYTKEGSKLKMEPTLCMAHYEHPNGETGTYVGDYSKGGKPDLGPEATAWQRACRKNPKYFENQPERRYPGQLLPREVKR